jgi:hypothetical protein
MSLIRTTCERCGTVELNLDRVTLIVSEEDAGGTVLVSCPECGMRFTKPADDAMMTLLVLVGIDVKVQTPPVERVLATTPLCERDLETFSTLLANPEAVFAELEQLDGPGLPKS